MNENESQASKDEKGPTPKGKSHSRWTNWGLFLASCFISLCILEAGMRLILPSLDSHEIYLPDPELGNVLRPGFEGQAQGVEVSINSHGLRSPEVSLEKPEGTFRILVLGDSWTYGVCIPQDQTYPAQLQKILEEKHPNRSIEVINTGLAGYETYNESVYFKRHGYQFEPDIVLVGYYPVNDFHDKKAKYERHAKEKAEHPLLYKIKRYPKTDMRTYQYFQYFRSLAKERLLEWWRGSPSFNAGAEELDSHYQLVWTDYYRDDFNGWKVAKESMKEIGDLSREIGAKTYMIVFPDLRDLKYYRTVLKDRFYPQLETAAVDAGFEVIDSTPVFEKYEGREEEIALGDRKGGGHPNAKGYTVIAEFLADRLEPEIPNE
ncbi:MAG: hypothetical protein KC931_00930 [Candidatus Omnitrophica bacterium]|nr:hypothetical protein [Candidatus Omnitrophota bacterium]